MGKTDGLVIAQLNINNVTEYVRLTFPYVKVFIVCVNKILETNPSVWTIASGLINIHTA